MTVRFFMPTGMFCGACGVSGGGARFHAGASGGVRFSKGVRSATWSLFGGAVRGLGRDKFAAVKHDSVLFWRAICRLCVAVRGEAEGGERGFVAAFRLLLPSLERFFESERRASAMNADIAIYAWQRGGRRTARERE